MATAGPSAAGEEAEPLVEPFEDLRRVEAADACRGQLDRERDPVEAPADIGHGSRVVRVDHESRLLQANAFHQESD